MPSKHVIKKISREKIEKVRGHAQMLYETSMRRKRIKKVGSQEEYENLAFQEAVSALILEFIQAIEEGK